MVSPACDDTLGRRIASAIRDALQVRAGQELTPEVIEERANNAACYVLEVLYGETAEEHAERIIT